MKQLIISPTPTDGNIPSHYKSILEEILNNSNNDIDKQIRLLIFIIYIRQNNPGLHGLSDNQIEIAGLKVPHSVFEEDYYSKTFCSSFIDTNDVPHKTEIITFFETKLCPNKVCKTKLPQNMAKELENLTPQEYVSVVNVIIELGYYGDMMAGAFKKLKGLNKRVVEELEEKDKAISIPFYDWGGGKLECKPITDYSVKIPFEALLNPSAYLKKTLSNPDEDYAQAIYDTLYACWRPYGTDFNKSLLNSVISAINESSLSQRNKLELTFQATIITRFLSSRENTIIEDSITLLGQEVSLEEITDPESPKTLAAIFNEAGLFDEQDQYNTKAIIIAALAAFAVSILTFSTLTVFANYGMEIIGKELNFGIVNTLSQFISKEIVENLGVQLATIALLSGILGAAAALIAYHVAPAPTINIENKVTEKIYNLEIMSNIREDIV